LCLLKTGSVVVVVVAAISGQISAGTTLPVFRRHNNNSLQTKRASEKMKKNDCVHRNG
jgi:hypothetical protein